MAKKLRVLFISKELIAADIAYQLKREGCDVRLFIENKPDKNSYNGIIKKTTDWRKELKWVSNNGLIVFDDVGYGKEQDYLREKGVLVIGGNKESDKLEMDREYGQDIMASCGIKLKNDFKTKTFSNATSAISFINKRGGKWVLKGNNHDEFLTYIGDREDGSDIISMLENYKNNYGKLYFSLQRRVTGVEIAIGRFFNGKNWVGPIVFNREHKHFCNDNIGPLGGETGTLMWYDDNDNNKVFRKTLAKIRLHLQKINYRGYIDINCIITDKKNIYPLEITSRFGSCTNELQSEIQQSPWNKFLLAIARGENYNLKYKKGFGIAVALTVPPFPYITPDKKLSQRGVRIFFDNKLSDKDFSHIHFEEVSLKKSANNKNYYVAGDTGYALYVTGVGKTVNIARKNVYDLIDKIIIPKMFYRTDIGLKFMNEDYILLKKWGWL